MRSRSVLSVTRGLTLLVLLVLLFFMNGQVQDFNYAKSSENWSKTPGFVIHSEVKIHISTSDEGGESTEYSPYVSYQYWVNDIEFKSDDIWVGGVEPWQISRIESENIVEKFSTGKIIEVYYNPKKPEDSALINGVRNAHMQPFVIDTLVLFGILAVLASGKYFYIRSIPKPFISEKNKIKSVKCQTCAQISPTTIRVCNYCGELLIKPRRFIFENFALVVYLIILGVLGFFILVSSFAFLYLGYYASFQAGMSFVFIILGITGFFFTIGLAILSNYLIRKIWGILVWSNPIESGNF